MMLTDKHKQAILRSWELVVPIADTAADLFYKRLFELGPQYRSMFSGDMAPQKRKLLAMLGFIVRSLDWNPKDWQSSVEPEQDLFLIVLALGRRHSELYRVPDSAYDDVAAALLWTLDYGLGEAFTEEVCDAWTQVYRLLAQTMMMGRCSVGGGSVVTKGAADG